MYVNKTHVRDAALRATVNRRSMLGLGFWIKYVRKRSACSRYCALRDCQSAIYAKPRIRRLFVALEQMRSLMLHFMRMVTYANPRIHRFFVALGQMRSASSQDGALYQVMRWRAMPSTSGANSSWVWCEKRTLGGGVGCVGRFCTCALPILEAGPLGTISVRFNTWTLTTRGRPIAAMSEIHVLLYFPHNHTNTRASAF